MKSRKLPTFSCVTISELNCKGSMQDLENQFQNSMYKQVQNPSVTDFLFKKNEKCDCERQNDIFSQQSLNQQNENNSQFKQLVNQQKNLSKQSAKFQTQQCDQQIKKIEPAKQIPKPEPFNIYMDSNFISRIFFIDMLKLILKASKDSKLYKVLTNDNLPYLFPQHSVEHTHSQFQKYIDIKIEKSKKQNKSLTAQDMLNVFLYTFKWEIITSILFNSLGYITKFLSSILISMLIVSISDNGITSEAYLIAAGLNAGIILNCLLAHNLLRINSMVVSIFKTIFMKVLYQKISSLSAYSVKEANVGKLFNLISNDLCYIEGRSNLMFSVLSMPIPLIAVGIYLSIKYGLIGFFGLGVMMLICPLQLIFSKINSNYFDEKSNCTDKRVNLTNEAVEGIRLIKMYAWEEAFIHSIQTIRKVELRKIFINTLITVLDHGIAQSFSIFGAFIIFYIIFHHGDSSVLDTALLFTTIDMLSFIKTQVLQVIGYGFSGIFSLKVILQRMIGVVTLKESTMMNLEENKENAEQIVTQVGQIEMKNFTAYWKENQPVLRKINLSINKNECVCIVGKVGTGKSSFLNCILKEIPFYKGQMSYKGKLAYVEQEPYIFSSTIKENILFGKEYDEALYQRVIQSCCLIQDLALFCEGDNTKIGERGANLSGGQRARISLARAMYSQADIYLLDDPLSAVDSKVARRLFFQVIQQLRKNATVILVTHQLYFSRYTDKIVMIDEGTIAHQGTYSELKEVLKTLQSDLASADITQSIINEDMYKLELSDDNKVKQDGSESPNSDEDTQSNSNKSQKNNQNIESLNYLEEQNSKSDECKADECKQEKVCEKKEQQQEGQEDEDVKVTYKTYFNLFKISNISFLIPITLALYVSSDILFVLFNRKIGEFDESNDKADLLKQLGYLVCLYILNQVIKHTALCYCINKVGKQLQEKMINSLIRSRVNFFDRNQSGKILNRFSSDIGTIDQDMSLILLDIIEIFSGMIVLSITIITFTPYFIIIVVFEIMFLVMFLRYCKDGLLQTKAVELTQKSPVLTFFNLTIQGVLPIKVYAQQQNFEKKFNALATDSLRASFYYWLSQRGFGSFIHLFATICNTIGVFMIISLTTETSSIGQSLIYFLTNTDFIQWGVRQVVQLDVIMTSTQRCLDIADLQREPEFRTQYDEQFMVKQEQTKKEQTKKAPQKQAEYKFPAKASLTFKNVSMRYKSDLDLVLNNLSFSIAPGKRVGFVGRTGAGKSSIIQALFRMYEIEDSFADSQKNNKQTPNVIDQQLNKEEADILIDGHSIKKLGLHTLRSGISIIPQVPFIFSSTIRKNLDPLDQYTDEQVNSVLKDIELYDKVYQLKNNLQEDMTNSSEIFSTGQKQLICLGRAILRQSQLIVLDEATANCDMLTDELIQRKIKERFANSTVITIAHRLNTIADYDEVVVMDKGSVAESGMPFELLNDEEGIFYQMVGHTGKKNQAIIYQVSHNKFDYDI